jgi:hypothetical protein
MTRQPAGGNVIPLRPNLAAACGTEISVPGCLSPFDNLTARLVLAQHRAGTLPEPVLLALLAGVGLRP